MRKQAAFALIICAFACESYAQAGTVVSPTFTGGHTQVYAPIQTVSRVQQVHSSSDFAALGGGAFITEIAFQYAFNPMIFTGATASNVMVTLSTTQRGPDSLNPVFAENSGPDEVVVYGTGPVVMPVGDRLGFDVFINFTTPFFYNPQAGNLLLDIRNFGPIFRGANDPGFDGQNLVGDPVSRLWANDPNASVANAVDSLGIIARFTFEPVPEPSTTALLALAGLGILGRMGFKIGKKGQKHGTARRITP